MRYLCLLLLLTACAGQMTEELDAGTKSSAIYTGENQLLPGIGWADANGDLLLGAIGDPDLNAAYFDADGSVWRFNPSSGVFTDYGLAVQKVYRNTTCSGLAFFTPVGSNVSFLPPRVVFRHASTNTYWFRNDATQPRLVQVCSSNDTGSCRITGPCPWNTMAIPVGESTQVSKPIMTKTTPLHPVYFVSPPKEDLTGIGTSPGAK